MSGYVKDVALLADCAAAAQTANWADEIWTCVDPAVFSAEQRLRIATSFREIATRFLKLPTWKETNRRSYSVADLGNVRRLQLLLAWWTETGDDHFADVAKKLALHPPAPRGWLGYSAWREGAELVELTGKLRDTDCYPTAAISEDIAELLEDDVVKLFEHGAAFDELESMLAAVEDAYPVASQRIQEAALSAIRRAIYDVDNSISDVDSESTLEDHAKVLEKFAPRAKIPQIDLDYALSKVRDRINEVAESTSVASSPVTRSTPRDLDNFDDTALASLFAPFLRKG